jgi:hypothetical protein
MILCFLALTVLFLVHPCGACGRNAQCGPPLLESEHSESAPGGSTGALVLVRGGESSQEACARMGHLPPLKSHCPSRGGERKSKYIRSRHVAQ